MNRMETFPCLKGLDKNNIVFIAVDKCGWYLSQRNEEYG
jgi:hypothetical protein